MKNKFWLILFAIVAIGVFFRFYCLGTIPQGFFSDEAAVGYNAYSIIKTGRDEFGNFLPLFFTSFGEGKLPLYVYQAIPSVLVFGPNEFAVRFPGALFGSLTILVWFFLLQELLFLSQLKKKYHITISLISCLVLAIMPWHVHFSRGVFGQESVFWIALGSWLILRGLKLKKQRWIFLGFVGLIASLMIYHSPKVILPLWTPFLLGLYWKRSKEDLIVFSKKVVIGAILLVFVWGLMSFNPMGIRRSQGISVFSVHSGVSAILHESIIEEGHFNRPVWYARLLHNKVESYGKEIIGRYLSHFNPDFLFVSGDLLRPRYRVPGVAQAYLIFLPFALIGFYYLLNKRIWLILILLALTPLPASLTFETPSTVRALIMALPLSAIIGLGFTFSFEWLKSHTNKVILSGLLLVFLIACFHQVLYFFNSYFYLAQIHKPYQWQYGYKPLVKKVLRLQDNYDQVIMTGMGGPPYIFFLFFQLYDPIKFQKEVYQYIGETDPFGFIHITGFDKYRFPKVDCPFDENARKTLFICKENAEGIDRKFVVDEVYFGDQTPAFTFVDPEYEK